MANLLDRLKNYLAKPPLPNVAFQISPHYLSGIYVSSREKKIKHHFISPLKNGVIQPSFNKKNVVDEVYLEEKIREGAGKLHLSRNKIACLIPEPCLKIFVFSFVSLPSVQKEREELIRWQVKKQMPLLPDDTRISFAVIRSNRQEKILVSLARASIIQEYEEFFTRVGLKVGVVGTATLSLFNLLDGEEGNSMIVNLEEDYISLIAVLDAEIALYRHKPFVLEGSVGLTLSQKIDNIATEVENTVNFIQDREKKKIDSLWIRLGIANLGGETFSLLREKLSLQFKGIENFISQELTYTEKQILSPLVGKILW